MFFSLSMDVASDAHNVFAQLVIPGWPVLFMNDLNSDLEMAPHRRKSVLFSFERANMSFQ